MTRRLTFLLLGCSFLGCAADEPFEVDEPDLAPEVRPDTPGNNLQFNFERGDVVETFASAGGRFLVHYARDGSNAVPVDDDDASGVPDFVEEVAAVYDEVGVFYETTLGFRAPLGDGAIPDNGGDDRFDVYLVDFAGVGDGAFRVDDCEPGNAERCIGFMTQENDYVGYGYPSTLIANRILGSHEFFHAVQAAYDTEQGSVLAEGTAVWATEMFDPTLEDFEAFLSGYMDNPDRPLDEPLPGPVDPFSYGSAVFFKYLEERFGAAAVVDLLERVENGAGGEASPYWLDVLDAVIADNGGTSFAEAFTEFATWNLRCGNAADPELSYADGADYTRVRMEQVSAPHSDEELRVYHASSQYYAMAADGRPAMTAALVAPADEPEAASGLRLLIAAQRDDVVDIVDLEDVAAGAETIDTTGTDRFITFVVNTATDGDAKKPGLCIGTVDEVSACVASLGGEGGGDAGGGDQGGSGTGGEGSDGEDTGDDEGCGCVVAGGTRSSSALALLLFGAAVLSQRRRRR